MFLFLIQNSSIPAGMYGMTGRDVYDAFVVAADSPEDALEWLETEMVPHERYQYPRYRGWLHGAEAKVTMIGTAAESVKKGVILYSWSSSG